MPEEFLVEECAVGGEVARLSEGARADGGAVVGFVSELCSWDESRIPVKYRARMKASYLMSLLACCVVRRVRRSPSVMDCCSGRGNFTR